MRRVFHFLVAIIFGLGSVFVLGIGIQMLMAEDRTFLSTALAYLIMATIPTVAMWLIDRANR